MSLKFILQLATCVQDVTHIELECILSSNLFTESTFNRKIFYQRYSNIGIFCCCITFKNTHVIKLGWLLLTSYPVLLKIHLVRGYVLTYSYSRLQTC